MDEPCFTVTLAPQGWTFDATPAQSLLQAGLAAGIRLPHSCRNGTCRACIALLTQGEIAYRIEWPGLSREEKEDGWILPCVACARTDLLVEAPYATRPPAVPGTVPRPPVLLAPKPPDAPPEARDDTTPATTQK